MNIDREVAEKVMGWMNVAESTDGLGGKKLHGQPAGGPWYAEVPPYSTNIEHAMEVEAEMRKRGYYIDMEGLPWGWDVTFNTSEDIGDSTISSGSLPEAICKAALAALEE